MYLDASAILSVILNEEASEYFFKEIEGKQLFSSRLLEAEVLSTLKREGIEFSKFEYYEPMITWIMPDRSLKSEVVKILEKKYLRGADLWHLACAMYALGESGNSEFCSLDKSQRAAARANGFKLVPGKLSDE